MYSKEQIADLILNNPEEFKKIKKDLGPNWDLGEIDFSGKTLDHIDLTGAELAGSNFSETNIIAADFSNVDLTSVDFTRSNIVETDFSDSILNGTDFSYSTIHYCNFTDSDMAGAVLNSADLDNSDFAGAENLSAVRFDSETIWPDPEMLPEDFDSSYRDDLSSLKDDEDETQSIYEY